MSFESTSPNMNLILPGVSLTAGPQWASDVNSSLTIIDGHNHAPGSGVQITPAGIDINTDLAYNGNGLISVKSLQFQSQLSPLSLLGAIYESGVDLWYNDGNGNQIQITSAGSVNAGSGSITGLVSPASATYVSGSQTFVWQSDVNTAANMDFGSAILRNLTASSQGITLSPPNALASSYTITLPAAVPSVTSIMQMSNAGIISANLTVDNTTIKIVSNQLIAQIGSGSITGSQIAAHTITENNLELRPAANPASAGQIAVSSSTGTFTTASTSFIDITNLSVTITTTGRPVRIFMQGDATSFPNSIGTNASASVFGTIQLLRGATQLQQNIVWGPDSTVEVTPFCPSSLQYLDVVTAGTYTYKMQGKMNIASNLLYFHNIKLVAYEI